MTCLESGENVASEFDRIAKKCRLSKKKTDSASRSRKRNTVLTSLLETRFLCVRQLGVQASLDFKMSTVREQQTLSESNTYCTQTTSKEA